MKDKTCPLGHKCYDCKWHVHLRGMDPQTGQDIDRQDCAITWLPLLLIENSRQQYGTSASIDSLRETVAAANQEMLRLTNDS